MRQGGSACPWAGEREESVHGTDGNVTLNRDTWLTQKKCCHERPVYGSEVILGLLQCGTHAHSWPQEVLSRGNDISQ